MSFPVALGDLSFWVCTLAAAVVLGGVWCVLFWLGRRGRRLEEVRQVFWSWVVLAAVLSTAMLLGREVFALAVASSALLACKQFARATGLYESWTFTGLVYLAILAVNGVALWPDRYDFFMATPIYAVAGLCLLPVLRNRSEGMLQCVALSVMAFVYFGFFLAHLTLLAGTPDPLVYRYLFFVIYGVATADLAGWLVNRRVRRPTGSPDGASVPRHPLADRINPDATWEGAAASFAWALLWSFTLGRWTFPTVPNLWLALVLSAFLLGPVGLLGDLALRYPLRDLGVRPLAPGTAFVPALALGHLHRLLFVAPLFFRLVHWFVLNASHPGSP